MAVYLALMRFIGSAFPGPQGTQRWDLLVAGFSLATATGPRPAIPEGGPLDSPRCQSHSKELGVGLRLPKGNYLLQLL